VLLPVEEIQILDGHVRIMTQAERVRTAPEFHEGPPNYEPYYEYWGTALVGTEEEPSANVIRPPGRLELEGETLDEELMEEEEEEAHQPT
jgi:hypothetical protein